MDLAKEPAVPGAAEDRSTASETEPPVGRSRELVWLLALWIAAIAFFWPALWSGKSLYFRDTHQVHYPQAVLTAKGLASGQLPLWEPNIGLGYPFHADPQSMLFYPLAALLLLVPFPLAYNLFAFVHVPLAGTFMYLLLRRWRLSPVAAGVGAAAMMFSGYVTSTFCLEPHLRALTWMPLAVLSFDCFLESGRVRFVAATALVVAVLGSSTDPQYVVFAGFLLACVPWMTPRTGAVPVRRACAGLGGVVLLSALLLAVVYLPLAEFVAASDRQELTWKELTTFQTELASLYNLVLPLPFPDLESPLFFASFPEAAPPYYTNLYWGFPVLVLALAALGWLRGRDLAEPAFGRTASIAGLVGAGCLLVSLGDQTPVFGALVSVVRPLRVFRFPCKYLMLVAFMVPVLAALGLEGLRQGRSRAWGLYGGGLAAAAAALAALIATMTVQGDELLVRFLGTWAGSMDEAARRQCLDTIRAEWLGNGWLYLGLVAGLGGLTLLRRRLPRWVPVAVLALVAAADLFLTARGSLSLVDGSLVASPPRTAHLLTRASPGPVPKRILVRPLEEREPRFPASAHDYFIVDSLLLDGLKGTLAGLDSLAFQLSIRTRESAALYWLLKMSGAADREHLAAAMGTRFTLSPEGFGIAPGTAEPLGRVGPVQLRRLTNVSPRVFIAPRARIGPQGTLEEWKSALLGLPGEAIFESPEAGPAPGPALVPGAIRECRTVEYTGGRIRVDFALEGKGLLVVLDVVYPGWEATVDGQERPILRVGRLFRGVEVREGERRLEMVYRPRPFRVGAALSLLGLVVAGALLVPWRKRGDAPPPGAVSAG